MAYDQQMAERVRQVLSGRRDVIEKKMMGGLCFMIRGGMCCSVSGSGGSCVSAPLRTKAPSAKHTFNQ